MFQKYFNWYCSKNITDATTVSNNRPNNAAQVKQIFVWFDTITVPKNV